MSFPFFAALTMNDVLTESSTAKHRVGTIGYLADGRRFRYCKAGAAIGGAARLGGNCNYAPGTTGHLNSFGFEGAAQAAAVAGATTIRIADTAARAVNYYEGAYLNIFHSANYLTYYVLSSKRSSVSTDPGYGVYVECELEAGLSAAVTTSTAVTAYLSPYNNIRCYGASGHGQSETSWVCLPLIAVTSGYYFWGQTGGPAWVTAHGGTWPGVVANSRDVFAHFGGTADPAAVTDPSSGYQRIGYLISATDVANTYGDAFIMLQLDGG